MIMVLPGMLVTNSCREVSLLSVAVVMSNADYLMFLLWTRLAPLSSSGK